MRTYLSFVAISLGLCALVLYSSFQQGWLTPDVRGKVMVVYARRGMRADSWAGMMSELHSALGAVHYARVHGAAGIRFLFDSSIYVDGDRGPNWWNYFFQPELIGLSETARGAPEVHLNDWIARYGRTGGFGHLVYGPQSHLYPMTYGLSRAELGRLIHESFSPRAELVRKVDEFWAKHFQVGDFVLGLHYRGLDTVVHWPYYKLTYDEVIAEARHVLAAMCPSCAVHVFVATDEREFLAAAQAAFGVDRVAFWDSPRAPADSRTPLHKDRSIANYVKGETVLLDAMLLAQTSYIIKGRSSVSEFSLALNPDVPYSFFVKRGMVYRNSLPSTPAWLGPDSVIPKD